jgi:DNA polymerase-1
MRELGFDEGSKASGIGLQKRNNIKARFEDVGVILDNHEILAIERTGKFVDVYDLEVEDTHNFIAGEICVHNCTNPNVQQIPHEDEFRRCFVAEEGNTLVIADYSQIELRILAEVSEDPAFVQAFQKGEDLHRLTAATMYGVTMEEVTKDQRSAAKRINFGLMYGRGARSLSAQLGTDEDRGRQLINEYFANYPKVQRFLQRTANRATRDGTLRTLAGRVRKFGNSPVTDDRGAMRREAMNYPIQGSSADIAKLALAYARKELKDIDANLINSIHDEFVVECAEELAPEVSQRMKRAMTGAGEKLLKKVPVEVEVAASREWTK